MPAFEEKPTRVLVRSVPASYERCLRESEVRIDVARARRQHRAYVEAIASLGIDVAWLPPMDDAPDSVFVEDPVVVLDAGAVMTRPGAPARRDEGASIAPALGRALHWMEAPATLDGGDVLRIGQTLFVGRSSRTNRTGFELLSAIAQQEALACRAVTVKRGLHLKSVCTRIGGGLIGWFAGFEKTPFLDAGIRLTEAPEPRGANVLDLGRAVLVSAEAPATAALLRADGYDVLEVDVSEFHKGDGALTCLSIRLSGPNR